MSRFFNTLIILTSFLLIFSCKKEKPATSELVFNITTPETKMSGIIDGAGDGRLLKARWEAGDQIAICDGTTIKTAELSSDDISNDGKSASFAVEGLQKGSTINYYAIFPASVASTVPSSFRNNRGYFAINNAGVVQDSHNSFFCVSTGQMQNGAVALHFQNAASILHLDVTDDRIKYAIMSVPGGSKSLASNYSFLPFDEEEEGPIVKIGITNQYELRYNLDDFAPRQVNFTIEPGAYPHGFSVKCYDSSNTVLYSYSSEDTSFTFSLGKFSILQSIFDTN